MRMDEVHDEMDIPTDANAKLHTHITPQCLWPTNSMSWRQH